MLPIKFNTFSSFYTTPPRFSLSTAFGKNFGVTGPSIFPSNVFTSKIPFQWLSFFILEETFGAKAANVEKR